MKRQSSLAGSLDEAVERLSARSFEKPVRADVGLLEFRFIFGRRINVPASTIFDDILLGCGMNGKEQSGEPTTYQTVAA